MALQTNVLVDGQWVNRTMDLDAVLLEHNQQEDSARQKLPKLPFEVAPSVGILSQTVIPSPVINLVFPAKLRGWHQNDVAFIGVRNNLE